MFKDLILDEPTTGVDLAAKREVRRLARRDLAVLLISSELNEVLALSDRLLVLHEGRVTAELKRRYHAGRGAALCGKLEA